MKSQSFRAIVLFTLLGWCLFAVADEPEQPQMDISQGAQGTFNLDWEGVEGRTYFMEFSLNLIDWYYAPFLDFGEGEHQRGVHSNTDKFFMRLKYLDDPEITSLDEAMNADLDGDGLSNIFEVSHGYNPFDSESTLDGSDASLDPDLDGIGNAIEQVHGTNPANKDNPFLQLEVIIN